MKYEVVFYLKSGQTINVICSNYNIRTSKLNGEFLGCSFEHIENHHHLEIDSKEIAAVTTKEIPNQPVTWDDLLERR